MVSRVIRAALCSIVCVLCCGKYSQTFFVTGTTAAHVAAAELTAKDTDGNTDLSSMNRIACLAFDQEGKTIVAGGWRSVGLWDAATGKHLRWLDHDPFHTNHSITTIEFTPDGKQLVSASNEGRIYFWDPKTGVRKGIIQEPWLFDIHVRNSRRPRGAPPRSSTDLFLMFSFGPNAAVGFNNLAISPDGKLVAAVMKDGAIHLWNLHTCEHVSVIGKSRIEMKEYPLSEIVTEKKSLRRWAKSLGKKSPLSDREVEATSIAVWKHTEKRPVYLGFLAFHPSGYLVSSDDFGLHAWNIETHKELFIIKDCFGFTISPDGKIIVAFNTHDGRTYFFNGRNGKEISVLAEKRLAYDGFTFSQDGRLLVSSGVDNRVRVWDVKTGKLLREFPRNKPSTSLLAVTLSPDGKTVAAFWSRDKGIRVWSVADGIEKFSKPN